jgi:hypothetical protein
LALLALAVVFVVKARNGGTEGLDTGGRTILSRSRGDRDALRAGETALDLVIGLGGALAEIGPSGGIFCIAVFCGTLGAPYYTSGGAGGIETGMGSVAFVSGSKLAMGFGLEFFSIA